MSRSEKQKMLAGEPYRPVDPEIQADQAATKAWLVRYNAASALPAGERRALLRERLAAVGEGAVIRPPFHCDYGFNIRLGEGAFLNFNCVILDVVAVTIGAGAQIGPGRPPARSGPAPRRDRVRTTGLDRGERLDRRRGHHPARRHGRGERAGGRGRCRHARRAARRDGGRQPGPSCPPLDSVSRLSRGFRQANGRARPLPASRRRRGRAACRRPARGRGRAAGLPPPRRTGRPRVRRPAPPSGGGAG